MVLRAQDLCGSRGGRPGLPVPSSSYGVCGPKPTLQLERYFSLGMLLKPKDNTLRFQYRPQSRYTAYAPDRQINGL